MNHLIKQKKSSGTLKFIKYVFLLLIYVNLVFIIAASRRVPKNDVKELVNKLGYEAEPHNVVTEDGYVLKIFRIKSPAELSLENKEPIFLQHGLIGSCEHYVQARNNSLAIVLKDSGYDVWLGNTRGNFHSRKHMTMDPDRNKEFWYYTLDQIGQYDLPASIDYVLNMTGRQKLMYVGHSQGAGGFLAMTSGRPEYNKKIKISIAMAPAAYMRNNIHPLLVLSRPYVDMIKKFVKKYNFYEIEAFFTNNLLNKILQGMCGENVNYRINCRSLIYLLGNSHESPTDYSLVAEIFTTSPAGISVYQLFHYVQLYARGKFERFDWGTELNMKMYNSSIPPKYDWSKITCPVAIFYGFSDGLVNHRDVKYVAKQLPNLVEFHEVADKKFNHIDFIWGIDIVNLVYNRVLKILNKYKDL